MASAKNILFTLGTGFGGYLWKKSQTHRYAQPFVQGEQNPFGQRVGAIINPLNEALKAGTLTYEQAQQASTDLETEVSSFFDAVQSYAMLGGKQAKIAQQAWETFTTPDIGGQHPELGGKSLLQSWYDTINTALESTKSQLNPPEAPTAGSILAPLGQTPGGQAQAAADQQRKRALAGGRQSTILGGARSTPTLRQPTILGY